MKLPLRVVDEFDLYGVPAPPDHIENIESCLHFFPEEVTSIVPSFLMLPDAISLGSTFIFSKSFLMEFGSVDNFDVAPLHPISDVRFNGGKYKLELPGGETRVWFTGQITVVHSVGNVSGLSFAGPDEANRDAWCRRIIAALNFGKNVERAPKRFTRKRNANDRMELTIRSTSDDGLIASDRPRVGAPAKRA